MQTLAQKIAKKHSIVAICNEENTCLVRATLFGACKLHPDKFHKFQMRQSTFTTGEMLIHFGVCPIWYYNDLRANHKRAQDLLAIRVCEALRFVSDEPLTYSCIPRLEEFLNINLYVISARMGDKFSYISAHHDQERKKVFLYHEDIKDKEHFHAIPNITGFFTSSYFCQHCLVPFKKRYRHHCVNHCGVCLSYDCRKGRELTCSECHRTCRSQACYRRHKTSTDKGFVPCQTAYKCPVCLQTFHISDRKRENHRCGHYTCKSCHQYLGTLPHQTPTVSDVETAPVRVVVSVSIARNHTAGKKDICSFLPCVRPHVRNVRRKIWLPTARVRIAEIDAQLVPRSIRRPRSTLNLPVPTHVGDANASSRPCTIWGSGCSVTRTRSLRSSSTTFLMTAPFSFNTWFCRLFVRPSSSTEGVRFRCSASVNWTLESWTHSIFCPWPSGKGQKHFSSTPWKRDTFLIFLPVLPTRHTWGLIPPTKPTYLMAWR